MSRPSRKTTSYSGYRSWFQSFLYNQQENIPIFILDYETHSQWEDVNDEYSGYENSEHSKSKLINGIQIYFLDENHTKRKAFLEHEPYFFALLEEELTEKDINVIMSQLKEVGEEHIIKVEKGKYYDAAEFTFLENKRFLKITVDRPASVPRLRSKSEEIPGIIEWREADVLFHHRCAIDHNVRVGVWYQAEIRSGKIQHLVPISNKAPPHLKLLAFDIETVFEITRDPNPNRDAISMISLFNGKENSLIVNSQVVKTENIRNFDIFLRKRDANHSIPWVDWSYSDTEDIHSSSVLERFSVNVIVVRSEEELLRLFFKYIRGYQPDILTDFFGGRFDLPFLAVRSEKYNISLEKETGFKIVFKSAQIKGVNRKDLRRFYSPANIDYVSGAGVIHLDAFLFNEKYSYLPKKDLGLKPSVEKKLKIKPIGREALFAIDKNPEEAVAYASCDGYITWKYVKEIVLDFFLSMGQLFPVSSSELLTRRAGSLDDLLIDAENYKHHAIGKRRISQNSIKSFSPNILIESLAYTGGLVESRRPGIWRSDLYYNYEVNEKTLTNMKNTIRDIVVKESNKLVKKLVKEEFDKRLISEFSDLKVSFSKDPGDFLKKIELELLRNGTPHDQMREKLNYIRDTLEEISSYQAVNVEGVISDLLSRIDRLTVLNGKTQLKGVHVDVTSMYPSQIRQYKLQPSGIVPLTKCRTCQYLEEDNNCYFEGNWVIKLSAHRPCRQKDKGTNRCSSINCSAQNEAKCKDYEPIQSNISRSQEIFSFDGKRTKAFKLSKSSILEEVPIKSTYFGLSTTRDPFVVIQQWVLNSIEATQLTTTLDQNHFEIFEEVSDKIIFPANTFLSLDVRTKKITILMSVQSRVCQKAYNFVVRIMDEFFNTRVRHKLEAKRLSDLIAQKKEKDLPVAPELLRQQKYHDSTQLGMKVPLNSIYGLLGMKGGVRNASMPCAGITTKLSADLIHWAANELEQIGLVTELDTDGIWLWVPKEFPLEFPVTIKNRISDKESKVFKVSLIDKILNEKVATFSRNDNYWFNNGETIKRVSKNLVEFEQDGPYDFQFVMGKKKYIVYNYSQETRTWIEKEITGLESKRADFSKLQKHFQERIINSYLDHYNPGNPITLEQLYENADKEAQLIRSEISQGKMDLDYFVKPKAINKPLREYKSKLPQVSAAHILKDLGFSIDPGTRIQMLKIKGNHVIPRQIFDFEFSRIKKVLVNHAIATLSFMLGELSTKEDLYKLIDVRQYIVDIFGPGRIYDRMIKNSRNFQQISSSPQQKLALSTIKPVSDQAKIEMLRNPKRNIYIAKKTRISNNLKKIGTSQKRSKKMYQSLETLFLNNNLKVDSGIVNLNINQSKDNFSSKEESKKKKSTLAQNKSQLQADMEVTEEIPLISTDELLELETNDIYFNGSESDKEKYDFEIDTPIEELIPCSECGALFKLQEITNEGCRYCGGEILNQKLV
ncbi:MAG: 3'-5' exonuclease [Candidatus Hodarchaeales archaeon]|jgi:DNA polymerase elongation subunit (family B)